MHIVRYVNYLVTDFFKYKTTFCKVVLYFGGDGGN